MKAFASTFVESMFMIIVTELGDKTFFIAAILAMRATRSVVFVGAVAALALMTVLSSAMGVLLPNLLPQFVTRIAAALLFGFFGVKFIREGQQASDEDEPEEMKEAVEALNKKRDPEDPESLDADGNVIWEEKRHRKPWRVLLPAALHAFSLTFMAEWGDRSQIATIAMASARDPFAVTAGGIFGHCLCTGLAVVMGRFLSQRISMKTISYLGGGLFLMCAVITLVQGA